MQSGAFFFFQVLIRISICKTIYNLIVLSLKSNKNVHNCALFYTIITAIRIFNKLLDRIALSNLKKKGGLNESFFRKKFLSRATPMGRPVAKKNFKKCWIYINVSPISAHGTLWWCECKLLKKNLGNRNDIATDRKKRLRDIV